MKETGLRDKACVVPVAIAASLGMAGMGLVSSGVVVADTTSVTDTINVTVQPSCTFNDAEDKTYIGSAANGTEVGDFNDSGVHEFNLFCNDNNGFIVTATPYDLEASGIEDVIEYTDSYDPSGVDSIWSAAITSDSTGVTVVPVVPVGGGTILSSDTSTATAGVDFSATYSAYVGTATPAGTYTGTIIYTLTASGTSNNSNSGNSGNNGGDNGGGDNSGTEVTDNTDSGDSGNGGSGAEEPGSGTEEPNDPSNTQSAAPMMTSLNNSYSTNNTYNTYNTTNYNNSGIGVSTPAATSTQSTTSGNDTMNGSNSEVSDSYENPLGVTTRTSSSSSESSGVDVMPVVVTGAALAVAGVAAIAVSQNKKKEESKK